MSEKRENNNLEVEKLIDTMLEDIIPEISEEMADEIPEPEEEHQFSPEHEAKMQQLFRRERRTASRRRFAKYTRRAAVLVVGLLLVSGVTIMSVDAWRVQFLNYFLNVTQEGTEFRFGEEGAGDSYATDQLTLDYIPDGFELQQATERKGGLIVIFSRVDLQFRVSVYPLDGALGIDTEDAEIQTITINGYEATLSIKPDEIILVWHDNLKSYMISGNISEEEILRIAENMKVQIPES